MNKSVIEFYIDESDTIHTMRTEGGIVSLEVLHEDFQHTDLGNMADLITAPMPGKIVKIFSKPGDNVKKGQSVLSLESMKMEYLIKAEKDATIKDIYTAESEFVQIGTKLVEFEGEVKS